MFSSLDILRWSSDVGHFDRSERCVESCNLYRHLCRHCWPRSSSLGKHSNTRQDQLARMGRGRVYTYFQ